MVLRLFNYALLSRFQPLFDDGVSALAVQPYFPLPLEYHRHTFSHVVEVEDAEEFVNLVLAVEVDGDRAGSPLGEDKPKVPVKLSQTIDEYYAKHFNVMKYLL